MQIFIKTINGKTLTLDVESEDTIKNMKEKLNKIVEKDYFSGNERYVFFGKALDEDRTLGDYNIIKDSTIFQVLRLCGC